MTRNFPALFLCACFLWACGPAGDDSKPNHDYLHAAPLKPNGKARRAFSSPDAEDWYKIEITRDSGILDLHIGGIRDIDFVLSFRDQDRQELKRVDETGLGGDEDLLDLGVRRGEYYVVVSNKNPKAGNTTQKYVLSSRLESSAGREMEPNDTPQTATLLEANGVMRGHYWPITNPLSMNEDKAEEDWFRLQVDRAGTFALDLDLSGVPNVAPVMEIYDANGYKLREAGGGVGEGAVLKDFGVRAPAAYNLRLRPRGRRMGNPDVFYELLNELRPYDGRTELEPNDQRQDATPFERDSLTGHIAPAGDVDWYRVNAATSPKQILRADLSAVPGMDLVLTVADEMGRTLLVVDNGGPGAPETLTGLGVTNATYYLIVSEKTGKASDIRHAYTLAKTLTPWQPGLEWEPNDSMETAQALKVGESVDGYLAPKGDVDFYEFNVYQKGIISFELTGVLNVRWSAELFDQDNRLISSMAAGKTGEALLLEKELDPGTCWIKLKAADPGQNNVRDKYSLRLKAR